jgi:hypothetical protein
MEFGIGITAGSVMHGNFGTPDRLVFSAIGPSVNEAARIEKLTKGCSRCRSGICIRRIMCLNTGPPWENISSMGSPNPFLFFLPNYRDHCGATAASSPWQAHPFRATLHTRLNRTMHHR